MKNYNLKPADINDLWFFDNGYFIVSEEASQRDGYEIITTNEQWRELVDTCIRSVREEYTLKGRPFYRFSVITPEILCKVLNNGDMKRNPRIKVNNYSYYTQEEKEVLKLKQRERRKKLKENGGNI